MRTLILVVLVCATCIGQLVSSRHSNLGEWTLYKKQHGKVYGTPEEDAHRLSLFLAAKDRIEHHNGNASFTYKLGLNHLSDWTEEELNTLTGFPIILNDEHEHIPPVQTMNDSLLKSAYLKDPVGLWQFDWRLVPNRVSEVKDQGKCASGWAFAAAGVLEGQLLAKNPSVGSLKSLSAQQLMDCSDSNDGCHGGRVTLALNDIAKLGGVESEEDYGPYVGKRDPKCKFDKSQSLITDSGFKRMVVNDLAGQFDLVTQFGPITVGLEVTKEFLAYKSGVFRGKYTGYVINHFALIVGYGISLDHGEYFVLVSIFAPG